MYSPKYWLGSRSRTANHRIQVAFIAVLAFAAGFVVSPFSGRAFRFLSADRATAPAVVAPASSPLAVAARNGDVPTNSARAWQDAVALYRQGERVSSFVGSSAAQQRAMELYRQGERAGLPLTGAAAAPHAWALYRQGERVSAGLSNTAQQHAMEVYRQGERSLDGSADPGGR